MRLLLVAMLILAGCAPESEAEATAVVENLYRLRIAGKMTGAPSEAELAKMAPYLSAELQALLRAAARLRDEEAKRAPDEKPPFAEGDMFTSLFEGPTTARVAGAEEREGAWRLKVEFTDDRADPAVMWTDYVLVVAEGQSWVVGDVVYAGAWDFANKGSLLESLKTGLQ